MKYWDTFISAKNYLALGFVFTYFLKPVLKLPKGFKGGHVLNKNK